MKNIRFLGLSLILAAAACDSDSADDMKQQGSDAATLVDATEVSDATTNENMDAGQTEQDAATAMDAGMNATDAGSTEQDAGISASLCNPDFREANACGGNIEGTWKYTEGCLDRSTIGMVAMACQGTVLRNEIQVATGTITFTSTMGYQRDLNDEYSVDLEVPSACRMFVGTCGAIKTLVESYEPRAQVDCLGNFSGGCDCSLEIKKVVNDWGTYEFPSTGVVRLTPNDSSMTAGDYYYCVDQGMIQYKGFSMDSSDHSVSYILTP